MSTNQIHPRIRALEQSCKEAKRWWGGKRITHHTRKWWKAWHRTFLSKTKIKEQKNE